VLDVRFEPTIYEDDGLKSKALLLSAPELVSGQITIVLEPAKTYTLTLL